MKTKDFIKMLQEEDPTGEAHIRMGGGVPHHVELKPGYWDGPYSFIDEDGNWNYSSQGEKVDVYTTDVQDFVYDQMNGSYGNPTWDEVKSKFKFSLTYSIKEQREERENRVLDEAKEAYDSAASMHERFRKEGEARALERESKGWRWFQNKLVDDESLRPNLHHYYTWKVYSTFGPFTKDEGSNLHNVEAVYKSGLFKRVDNNVMPGYYEWIKIKDDEKLQIGEAAERGDVHDEREGELDDPNNKVGTGTRVGTGDVGIGGGWRHRLLQSKRKLLHALGKIKGLPKRVLDRKQQGRH